MNKFQRYFRHILYLEGEIDREAAAAGIRKNIY